MYLVKENKSQCYSRKHQEEYHPNLQEKFRLRIQDDVEERKHHEGTGQHLRQKPWNVQNTILIIYVHSGRPVLPLYMNMR